MKFTLPGELTDLNTYINAERSSRFIGAKIKKDETEWVYNQAKKQKLRKVDEPNQLMTIYWYCKDRKKDPDNISFATKFILDGLKMAGVIPNDGWKQISGFHHMFFVDAENPRIEVEFLF